MELSLKLSTLVFTILFTGISAGLCFTWLNAVTPGIGRLETSAYLQAFQQMNRAIINPLFILVFFGPFILNIANIYVFRNASKTLLYLLIIAAALYFLGVILVTILGNIPLNEMIEKIDFSNISESKIENYRKRFEVKWNRWHLIRTVTSFLSFLLLLVVLIISQNQTINT